VFKTVEYFEYCRIVVKSSCHSKFSRGQVIRYLSIIKFE